MWTFCWSWTFNFTWPHQLWCVWQIFNTKPWHLSTVPDRGKFEKNIIYCLFCFQFNGAIFKHLVSFQDDISANDILALYTFQLNLNPRCPNVLTNRYLILKLCMQRSQGLAMSKDWGTEGARLVRWWWWASRNMKLSVSHTGAKVSTGWPRTGHWMATFLH